MKEPARKGLCTEILIGYAGRHLVLQFFGDIIIKVNVFFLSGFVLVSMHENAKKKINLICQPHRCH